MIIHHRDLKKNKKNEISIALNRAKRKHHKLSTNAKSANIIRIIFITFALIATAISLCIMSYNLIKPQIDKLNAKERHSSKTEPNSSEYKMIYNPQKGEYEIDLN